MKPILSFIVSRGRPERYAKAMTALMAHTDESDYLLVTELKHAADYPQLPGVMSLYVDDDSGSCDKLHELYDYGLWRDYEIIIGISDDNVVTAEHFDTLLAAPIRARGWGWSYGDDGIQHENLPTFSAQSTRCTEALGAIVPRGFMHLYTDNALLALGRELGAIDYVPEATLLHEHWLNGKAELDATYEWSKSKPVWDHDRAAWERWKRTELKPTADRIRAHMGATLA